MNKTGINLDFVGILYRVGLKTPVISFQGLTLGGYIYVYEEALDEGFWLSIYGQSIMVLFHSSVKNWAYEWLFHGKYTQGVQNIGKKHFLTIFSFLHFYGY